MRGEVWDCAVPRLGPHPVVILTVNRIADSLSAVTIALVTGSSGPPSTHVQIGPDAGVTKYDESFINCTDLHSVDKAKCYRQLGRLAISELKHVERNLRLILGL